MIYCIFAQITELSQTQNYELSKSLNNFIASLVHFFGYLRIFF